MGTISSFQMKVLIPHDVASDEAAAVKAAAARPWPAGTTFCVLNVNVPLTPPLVVPRLFENTKAAILKRLEPCAQALKQAGLQVRTEVREGSPRRVINAFAKEWNADLVMVGAHERSQLTRLFLGSVALSVVRHSPCSVEIVRAFHKTEGRPLHPGMKILVGTDGSQFSAAALRWVVRQPWPAESRIKVISVPEFILTKDVSYLETHEIKEFKELGTVSIEEAKSCIAAAREILSHSPLPILSEVPEYEDRTYQVILHEAEAWHTDLIVMGSHGRSGFDRVVMGSVSEAVALHAQCSVQVVRERNS
jgi:nucleotide-binding universal stress UspA family protein